MNLSDYLRIIFFPFLILLVVDIFDYVGTIYFEYRKTIPDVYIDIIFLIASIPVYVYMVFKVVAKEGGDREDAAIATFLLAFIKWAGTWLITFGAFHFMLADGTKMPVTAFTKIVNPYSLFFSYPTIEQFAYHVIGAIIGGFILGALFEGIGGGASSSDDSYQLATGGGMSDEMQKDEGI